MHMALRIMLWCYYLTLKPLKSLICNAKRSRTGNYSVRDCSAFMPLTILGFVDKGNLISKRTKMSTLLLWYLKYEINCPLALARTCAVIMNKKVFLQLFKEFFWRVVDLRAHPIRLPTAVQSFFPLRGSSLILIQKNRAT